ncbi:Uncharacterized conserved protein YdeI, YjbR/CyaY-like superfamily, DUF1801 family [Pedobacter steynii]|uniref:Uncharacterized conserved protein YdeI, YjbR/CyaY-like superfamily, DUF1801 family n=1 Tax=Pedobacter steynii TaxID=430522 RepID=A0A1G9ZA03_9SPHI|nr:YdeI/OmpD-associated family protein [Pedobacter steynii]NQX40001.1 YdeI/OmpD-associated family protein [Pedobacter steynii]SDN18338.1 Uncharacterized conserved protein YdeI, YjbR/CyaY-like superfamily, DUF1801 family [Pedobacter steynii]
METNNGIPAFYASTNEEWRNWLEENGAREKAVCLILYHKKSKTPCIDYKESIEHALCFGWIDSKANKRDEESSYLQFTPRKSKSNWSNVNKERVARMTAQGLMRPGGQAMIDLAKANGSWDMLADAQNTIIPWDLQKMFDKNIQAFENFQRFSPSSRRMILEWITKAKKEETREKRIVQTVELATRNIKANH